MEILKTKTFGSEKELNDFISKNKIHITSVETLQEKVYSGFPLMEGPHSYLQTFLKILYMDDFENDNLFSKEDLKNAYNAGCPITWNDDGVQMQDDNFGDYYERVYGGEKQEKSVQEQFSELIGEYTLDYIMRNNWVEFSENKPDEISIDFFAKDGKNKVIFCSIVYDTKNEEWYSNSFASIGEKFDSYDDMGDHLKSLEQEFLENGFDVVKFS